MTVNKFGRYLNQNNEEKNELLSFKVTKNQVNFENRFLRNVHKAVSNNDVVIKSQLDEAINLCLIQVTKNSQSIEDILKKIQSYHPPAPTSNPLTVKPKKLIKK